MPNYANTIVVGDAKGGYRTAYYKDVKGRYWKCKVISGPSGGPYTVRLESREAAGIPPQLTGIVLATSKASTNAVHPSPRFS